MENSNDITQVSGPLVSVILPAYNAEGFLRETIPSVLKQTHQNLELIVVNDGSKDDTAAVAQEFLIDSRVQYFAQENAGVSVARNTGYAKSKGDFIAFLDADDVLLPENLSEKLALFAQDASLGLVHADLEVINAQSERTGKIMSGQSGQLLEKLLLWEGTCIPTPSSILVKREVVEKVGGFDPALSNNADMEFFFRVTHQYPVGRVAKVLALYRDHDKNMHKNLEVMEKDTMLAYQRAAEHQLFPSSSIKNQAFANMHMILAGSWWKDGNNKSKGLKHMASAIAHKPAMIGKIFGKLFG